MKQLSTSELELGLIEVRKSYRLLYFYQRRVMDTVSFIANTLSKNINSGFSLFSKNPPRNGFSLNMDAWAWDWLNMYDYEFHFGTEKINGHDYKFSIAIQADSGYYDGPAGITETDVDIFAPVEKSTSKIYFMLGKNTWKPEGYETCWDTTSKDIYTSGSGDVIFITRRFNLSDFGTEEAILSQINLLREFYKREGVEEFLR